MWCFEKKQQQQIEISCGILLAMGNVFNLSEPQVASLLRGIRNTYFIDLLYELKGVVHATRLAHCFL